MEGIPDRTSVKFSVLLTLNPIGNGVSKNCGNPIIAGRLASAPAEIDKETGSLLGNFQAPRTDGGKESQKSQRTSFKARIPVASPLLLPLGHIFHQRK